jgi:3-mercaptopropionate dioxygenase
MSLDFHGKSLMLKAIDEAVSADTAGEITQNLRQCLSEMVADERIRLPECVYDYSTDHYCRRLLHQDEARGYSVLAMTWGPGQSTPLHDHAGMWCVEAVWHGEIEVVQFELTEREANEFRLEPRTTMRTGVGSAGSLIPPHEYHTIANPSPDQPAITVHIYSGVMDECCVFQPIGDDWFQRKSTPLGLDAD